MLFIFFLTLQMKKAVFLILNFSLLLFLTACWPQTPPTTTETTNQTTGAQIDNSQTTNTSESTSGSTSDILSSTNTSMICSDFVLAYLNSSSPDGSWTTTVASWDEIVVDYIGRLADGSVFDTSVESVAKGCGVYSAGRDYTAGLPFKVWAWQMIAGFDAGVIGMKVWQTKTIEILAKDAYGEYSEENVVTYPLSEIPNPDDYTEGMKFYAYWNMPVLVKAKTDTEITLDYNHELAGKNLTFDITIKEIK